MDTIFSHNYNIDLPPHIKDLMMWKNEFPNSKINILSVNNTDIVFNIGTNEFIYNLFAMTLHFPAIANVDIIEDGMDFGNIYLVLKHLESLVEIINPTPVRTRNTQVTWDNVYDNITFDDDGFTVTNNRRTRSSKHNDWEMMEFADNIYSDEYIDDAENIRLSLINVIKNYGSRNKGKVQINFFDTGDLDTINVKVKVQKTPFTFTLSIDKSNFIELKFVKVQPYKLFYNLLIRDSLFDPMNSSVEPDKIIDYVANKIIADQDKAEEMKLDIDGQLLDSYDLYGLTIDDYLLEDPKQTLQINVSTVMATEMLSELNKIYNLLIENKEDIIKRHLYIIYPIIAYYVHITDIDIMIKHIEHYEMIKNIMELVWDPTALEHSLELSIYIGEYLATNTLLEREKTVLEFFMITFS